MTEYKCGSAKSCKYGDMCKPNFNIGACSHYKAEEPMTNEEWFCQLPTKEKAKWLYDHYVNARAEEFYGRPEKTLSEYQKWLVSVHREIDGTKID